MLIQDPCARGHALRASACALLFVISGCTNLKSPDQRATDGGLDGVDSGGQGGQSGAGMSGGSAGMSGAVSGGSGAAGASGGTGGQQPVDPGASDAAADAMDSDVEDAGDAAVADAEGAIAGRVIDYFENPVPGALVTLEGETVTTDEDGAFAFGPTPREYSIGVALEVARFGGAEASGYLFVGLTRRDPTLQIYRGLPKRSANVTRNVTGVTFPLPSTQKIPMDVAGRFGGFSAPLTLAAVTASGEWEGPAQAQAYAHAIHYEHAAAAPQLPTSYLAHDTQPLALDDDLASSFTLDLSGSEALTAGIVSGTASGSGVGYRVNDVFVRFTDDAAVRVVSHVTSSDAFSYLVPAIATSSIAVAAMRGEISSPPYAVAYAEGIAPGANDVELAIPAPATLLSPATTESGVDAETVFSWSGPEQVYMFVADALNVYESFYVITTDTSARIPVDEVMLPSLRSEAVYEWSVRTHRTFATVDAAAGPTGYLDSFCYGRLRGPRRDSASHTSSELRSFTTAP